MIQVAAKAECGWCGSSAGGPKGRCRDCGGKLGLRGLSTTKATFERDDAARRADPLLGSPGAADAFRELWLGPVVLGVAAVALGLSVSHGGRAAFADAMRFGGPVLGVAVGPLVRAVHLTRFLQ